MTPQQACWVTAALAVVLLGGRGAKAAESSIPNADVGVARQPMPPPRFEIDCEKTNDAPALLHARQPRATIVCPANCSTAARSVQGGESGIYQRDSSICKAAIHAGALGAAGGNVTVYFQPLLRSWNNYMEGWCMHSGSSSNGIESLAINSTVDNAFTFEAEGGLLLCSHMGAEARSTGGNPAAILAAVREFSISCDMTDGDGALVDFYFPLALISCPANCTSAPSRGVVGSSPYECASSVCQAAIHAGVITNAGGKFWLNHEEGQPAYLGSSSNGVASLNGSSSSCAFDFNVTDHPWEATCGMIGLGFNLQSALFRCPPGCGIKQDGISACGSGPYNAKFSAVCPAAVHAGAITNAGGVVLVHRQPGLQSYTGSIQNGFETVGCGGEGDAFIVEKPPENPVGTTTAMLGGWAGTTLATFNGNASSNTDANGWNVGGIVSNSIFNGA